MKNLFILLLLSAIILLGACSDNTTNPSKGNLSLVASLSQSTLTNSISIKNAISQTSIDAIYVDSVKILISRIMIHGNDSVVIKTDPTVYFATSDTQYVEFANAEIQSGTYNKIKYEFHRFTSNEIPVYQNDDIFKDFATNERYTVIIDGKTIIGNDTSHFTYKTDIVANLTFNFNPPLTIDDNNPIIVDFVFDTEQVFMDKGVLLDPNSSASKSHIDNNIKTAIRANKK